MGDPWKIDDTTDAGVPWKVDDTTKPKREPDSIGSRVLHGALDPIYGLAQGADKLIVNPVRQFLTPGATSMDDVVKQREQNYSAPEGVDWARIGGNVVSPATLATLPLQAAGRGTSAAVGAGTAMLEPTTATGMDYAKEKARQAAIGGGIGFVAPGLPKTAEARRLMDAGIQPSAGQAAGTGFGWMNKLEQAMQSLPIVGETVVKARTRPLNEFGERTLQTATGKPVKTLDEANAAVSDMYQTVAPHLPQHQLQPEFYTTFQRVLQNPELTPTNQKLLYDLAGNRFANYEQLSGSQLKNLDSDIGQLVRKYRSSTDVSHHAIADGLQEIQQSMRATWENLLPPHLKGRLQEANTAYRNMVPVNKAASTRGDERIMPRPLQRAMARQAGVDVSRLPPDNLIDPALKVLPNNLPDSGTGARLLATDVDTLVKAGLAKIPGELLYSRPMQRVLTGNTPWQTQRAAALSATTSAALRNRRDKEQDDGR